MRLNVHTISHPRDVRPSRMRDGSTNVSRVSDRMPTTRRSSRGRHKVARDAAVAHRHRLEPGTRPVARVADPGEAAAPLPERRERAALRRAPPPPPRRGAGPGPGGRGPARGGPPAPLRGGRAPPARGPPPPRPHQHPVGSRSARGAVAAGRTAGVAGYAVAAGPAGGP